jgi:capsid protein
MPTNSICRDMAELHADYNISRTNRWRRQRFGVPSMGAGADWHYRGNDYLSGLVEARAYDRDDVVVSAFIDRAVTNVLQGGIHPDPKTGDPAVNTDLSARWLEWSTHPEKCDLRGKFEFDQMTKLALRGMFVDGDHIGIATPEQKIQTFEGHRLRTPANASRNKRPVVQGVLLDETGRHVQYWITKEDVNPDRQLKAVSEVRKIDTLDSAGRRQVFHLYDPERSSQTRGMSRLRPIIDQCGHFEDINFAALVRIQMAAFIGFLEEAEAGVTVPGPKTQMGERTEEARHDGSTEIVENMQPGARIRTPPGWKIRGFAPNFPNPEYLPHMHFTLKLIAINFGLPVNVALMDASDTNFSGWRASIDEAKKGWRAIQKTLISMWLRPTYEMIVSQWVAQDSALRNAAQRDGVNILATGWHRPKFQYIQPLQDASADALRLEKHLVSPQVQAGEQGEDFEERTDQIIKNNLFGILQAAKAAAEGNAELQRLSSDLTPIDWSDLYMPAPARINRGSVTPGVPAGETDGGENPESNRGGPNG